MNWTVRARCHQCGDVHLPSPDITVFVSTVGPTYRFNCPRCQRLVERACSPHIVAMLVDVGCPSNRPAELDEAHTADPITADEQLDYYLGLAVPDFIAELLETP